MWDDDWGTFDDFKSIDGETLLVCPQCGCKEGQITKEQIKIIYAPNPMLYNFIIINFLNFIVRRGQEYHSAGKRNSDM